MKVSVTYFFELFCPLSINWIDVCKRVFCFFSGWWKSARQFKFGVNISLTFGPTSASVAAELSHALSTALSLSDNKDFASDNLDSGKQQVLDEPSESLEGKVLNNVEGETLSKSNRKSNTDINKLLQQHYCSHKNKKKHPVPSAGAIR